VSLTSGFAAFFNNGFHFLKCDNIIPVAIAAFKDSASPNFGIVTALETNCKTSSLIH
jgi:hypothetical protein